jgi:hypothetical protein
MDAAELIREIRALEPWDLADVIGGTVEEGSTPTTQGMVRVVGPWVARDA